MAGLKNLKKTRRIQLVSILMSGLFATLFAIWWFIPADSFQYFRAPAEVMSKPPRPGEIFRLGGLVAKGSLVRGQGETVLFTVTDGAQSVPVSYTGVLPDLFKEGTGMIGTGVLVEGTFVASEILAKHDEKYMPKEVVDALKAQGVYQAPVAEPNG